LDGEAEINSFPLFICFGNSSLRGETTRDQHARRLAHWLLRHRQLAVIQRLLLKLLLLPPPPPPPLLLLLLQ
jgi:hypothetical protein